MSKTLIAESIAELKELKRVTIENAKLEFAETITPQIRAILESSLAEEAEEAEKDEMEESKKKEEEAPAEDKDEEAPKGEEESEEEVDETFDIDAALAEIEGSLGESDDNDEDDAPAVDDEEDMKEAEEAPEADVEVEGGEEDELDEDYINRLLAEVEDEEAGEEEMHEASEEEDEVIDVKEVEGADKKDEQLGLIGKAAEVLKKVFPNLDAEAAKKFEKDLRAALDNATGMHEEEEKEEKEEEATEEDASEQALLESLRKEAKELNLLNSKLLFQNKLLTEGNLSDEQKAGVIKALDKAKTVNEAKIVYETYKNVATGKKAPQPKISEQLGFRKIGVLQEAYKPKTSYDPTDPVVAELQRRAGIRK